MNKKIILLILMLSTQLFAWGGKGHWLITQKAVENLPIEMEYFHNKKEYLCKHSIDADLRKKEDPSEKPKHYIDIDFYREFNLGEMIISKEELVKIYSDSVVTDIGVLPWVTQKTLENLTQALKNNNNADILFYTADLAHYVADGHQPQHTILNYNGQLTDQKGIHRRYETNMVNLHLDELEKNMGSSEIKYLDEPMQFIFDYIYEANSFAGMIELADKHALKYSNGEYDKIYLDLLWFRTKFMTYNQFSAGAEDLAALIYTAWIDAGKPNLGEK